ncbi:MAG TPA: RNA polymerase sporulation sigma factor SigF [Epulopiscium sp.]|nr:RNA polymerase sporulation sigma factor SigF [Candidatus Epulonipiscium sp.]
MDRTIELIAKAQQGDDLAKEQLVEENLGLIWSLVRRFTGRGYDLEDLFQVGSIGLIKSIDKFDFSFGVRFSTYAVPMILGEIKRFLRDDGMIKVSRSLKEVAYKAKLQKEELLKELDREPTICEIAAALDLEVEEIVLAMEANVEVDSLQSIIHQGEGRPVTLSDKVDQSPKEQQNIVDKIMLGDLINDLKPIEKQIIVFRYFQDRTQTEIGELLGISQVQVSRIEKRVLNNMKKIIGKA